jgi:3D (Asp-Asp-Asp) domain-containing protein
MYLYNSDHYFGIIKNRIVGGNMAVTFNETAAKMAKEASVQEGFTYDTVTDGGCLNKFDEVGKLISDISTNIETIGGLYTTLQGMYNKFTDFNDTMNTNKTGLRNSIDAIKKGYDQMLESLKTQVGALQQNDAALMSDLEGIDKMISNSQTQDQQLADTRNKNDAVTPGDAQQPTSTSKTDEEINQAVDDVMKGKYGTGEDRKKALKEAGFDPAEVQKRVNERINGGGSSNHDGRSDAPKGGTGEAGYVPKGADEHPGTGEGTVLNSINGRIQGPSGEETYYNKDMNNIVAQSQPGGWIYNEAKAHGNEGNLSSNYWVREDGCKMMGDYIMVAADLNVHPRGSIVQTSLGPGIVVDTGDFAKTNHNQLDIATTW